MRERLERLASAFAALAVAAIVTIAFVARWQFLNSTPYPVGIDGFYYATQLRSLLQDHQLYYPASPMVFWLMLPGAWMLGPIAGAKLGAALGTALAAVPVYAIVRRATGVRAAGVAGAALVATAAGSFYMVTVAKQGVGLTLALAFVATLAAALDARDGAGRSARFALAAALFAATLLSHLSAVGLAVMFTVPLLWVHATRNGSDNRLRAAALSALVLAILAALVVMVVPATRHGMGLAHLVGPASADFTGPYSFHHEVPLAALAAVLWAGGVLHHVRGSQAAVGTGVRSTEARALLVGPAVLGLMLAFPWLSTRDPEGLVFRLRIMAFIPLAICAPAAVAQLITKAPRNLQQLLLIASSAGLLALMPLRYGGPVAWPNASLVPGAAAVADHTAPGAVIIVKERHLAFMLKWAADREARTMPLRAGDARPTFRLATPGVLPPSVLRELEGFEQRLPAHLPRPVRLIPKRPDWMILFAEPTWQALIHGASAADRALLEPWSHPR